jgi:hypothetical protein
MFTYINRADPWTQLIGKPRAQCGRPQRLISLIAAVSDVTGHWASGSPMVRTQGSTDVDCLRPVSSSTSTTGSAPPTQSLTPTPHSTPRVSHGQIGAISGGAAAALLIAGALLLWALFQRRRPPQRETSDVDPFTTMVNLDALRSAKIVPVAPVGVGASSSLQSFRLMPMNQIRAPTGGDDRVAPTLFLDSASASLSSSRNPPPQSASLPEIPPPYASPQPSIRGARV